LSFEKGITGQGVALAILELPSVLLLPNSAGL